MDDLRPLPSTPSAEARAILAGPIGPYPVYAGDAMPAIRAAIRAGYSAAVERARDKAGLVIEPVWIGGVPCLEVRGGPATILYFYGGGYITGSPYEDLVIAAPLARAAGARIVIPAYRLAPEHPHPAQIQDGMAVYRGLAAAGPFALAGESAGGNLALSCVLAAHAEGLALPARLALLSPWCDLTHAGPSHRDNDGRDPTLSAAQLGVAARLYAGAHDLADPAVSPLWADYGPWMPPTLITTATRDLLLSQSEALGDRLNGAGATCRVDCYPDLWHVFEFDDRLPEAAQSIARLALHLRL